MDSFSILITTKLLEFVHRPDFYKQKTQRFGNWIWHRQNIACGEASFWFFCRVGAPPSSPEDGNRSSFRNVMFSVCRNPDDGQSPEA
jgi:hypothetical protein